MNKEKKQNGLSNEPPYTRRLNDWTRSGTWNPARVGRGYVCPNRVLLVGESVSEGSAGTCVFAHGVVARHPCTTRRFQHRRRPTTVSQLRCALRNGHKRRTQHHGCFYHTLNHVLREGMATTVSKGCGLCRWRGVAADCGPGMLSVVECSRGLENDPGGVAFCVPLRVANRRWENCTCKFQKHKVESGDLLAAATVLHRATTRRRSRLIPKYPNWEGGAKTQTSHKFGLCAKLAPLSSEVSRSRATPPREHRLWCAQTYREGEAAASVLVHVSTPECRKN